MDNNFETIFSLCRKDYGNPCLHERLKEATDNSAWEEITRTAEYHGLLPVIYGELENKYKSLVPDKVYTRIKESYLQTTINSINSAGELVKILGELKKNRIEALVFKGPVLSCSSYGDLTMREYTDIDLMVDKTDIAAVKQLLTEKGYAPQFEIRQDYVKKYTGYWYFENFYSPGAKTSVDLHWRTEKPAYSFSLGFYELKENSKEVDVLNHQVMTFSDENNVIYLCQHGCKHGWERIVWILDLHRHIESCEKLDWKRVFTKAEEINSLSMVMTGLILCHRLFGTELPEKTKQLLLGNKKLDRFSNWLISSLCCGNKPQNSYFFLKHHDMVYLKSMSSNMDRLRFIASFFQPTPLEWELGLPLKLYFIYYFYRPFRLLKSKILNK